MDCSEYATMYYHERSHWWFLGKQFLILNYLSRILPSGSEGASILDVGCGTGAVLNQLRLFGRAYGVERSPNAIAFLRKRALRSVIQTDVNQSIPFKNDSFSVITCLDVLEHLEDDRGAIREMLRVCKPGGHIFLTVPAFDIFWSNHDVALHHKRRYTRKKMFRILKKMKCRVKKWSYYNSLLSIPILVFRRFNSCVGRKDMHSDLAIRIPKGLNRLLTYFLITEIRLTRCLNFPWGVSLFLVIEKQ